MAEDEAVRLIEELRDHATQEQFVYRPEEHRIMLRTIVHPF